MSSKRTKGARRAFLRAFVSLLEGRQGHFGSVAEIHARTMLQAMGALPYQHGQPTVYTLIETPHYPKPWVALKVEKTKSPLYTILSDNNNVVADNVIQPEKEALNHLSLYFSAPHQP